MCRKGKDVRTAHGVCRYLSGASLLPVLFLCRASLLKDGQECPSYMTPYLETLLVLVQRRSEVSKLPETNPSFVDCSVQTLPRWPESTAVSS